MEIQLKLKEVLSGFCFTLFPARCIHEFKLLKVGLLMDFKRFV